MKRLSSDIHFAERGHHRFYVFKGKDKQYRVYHTGPRPDLVSMAKARRAKISKAEVLAPVGKPISTYRLAKACVEHAMQTFDSYAQ